MTRAGSILAGKGEEGPAPGEACAETGIRIPAPNAQRDNGGRWLVDGPLTVASLKERRSHRLREQLYSPGRAGYTGDCDARMLR